MKGRSRLRGADRRFPGAECVDVQRASKSRAPNGPKSKVAEHEEKSKTRRRARREEEGDEEKSDEGLSDDELGDESQPMRSRPMRSAASSDEERSDEELSYEEPRSDEEPNAEELSKALGAERRGGTSSAAMLLLRAKQLTATFGFVCKVR